MGRSRHLEILDGEDVLEVQATSDSRQPGRSRLPGLGQAATRVLAASGGVAGARYIADRLSQDLGRDVSVRRVRDLFRNYGGGVWKAGAGYYALRDAGVTPVRHFAERWVATHRGRCNVDDLVSAILDEYPHGHGRAIKGWIAQEPGLLRQDGDAVWLGPLR